MKWLCTDNCSWQPSRGKRAACPMCCGWTIIETATRKRWFHDRELLDQQSDRLAYKQHLLDVGAVAEGEAAAAPAIGYVVAAA